MVSLRISQLSVTVRVCAWAALLTFLGLWAISTLSWPLARDQGVFAWAGSVILNGGVLYRDAWDVKGPVAVLPFTLAQFLFGHNMWGIRVLDLLARLVNLAALAVIARRFWDGKTAKYTVVLCALFATWLNFGITAQPDEWCGCAITIVVAMISTADRELPWWIIAVGSFFIGLCILEKPVYAIFLLLFAPFAVSTRRIMLKSALFSAIGTLIPIVATLAYFGSHHAIGSLVNTYLLFNLRAHLQLSGSVIDQIRNFLTAWQLFLPLSTGVPLALFGMLVLMNRSRRWGALYSTWLCLTVLAIVIQGKYFEYQRVPLLGPVALGAGVALRQLRALRPEAPSVVLFGLVLLFANDPLRSIKDWALYKAGKMSVDDYDSHFTYLNKNHYDFLTISRLSQYVAQHSLSTETIQVWGFDAGINYLSNRAAPTRFGYTYPLQIGYKNPYQDAYRTEFLAQIQARPPRYVLVPSNDAFGLMPVSSDQSFSDFTEFYDFVRAHYDAEKLIANWTLYRLR